MSDVKSNFNARLNAFVEVVGRALRSDTQRSAFARYVAGLMGPTERKSVEPIAAQSRPDNANAEHFALLYFVGKAPWSDPAVRRAAAAWALWGATAAGSVLRTIVDDTGILKSGEHSVGVARQYTGSAGKVTNCQVAVSLSVATAYDAILVDMGLYLPESWALDDARRIKAGIPDDILYQPKWDIAIDLLRAAHRDGVPLGRVVNADADYGRVAAFRRTITELGLAYAVGVYKSQQVYYRGQVQSVQTIAASIRPGNYERIEWREGSRGKMLSARFAFRRVRVSNEESRRHARGTSQWLVIEWRDGEDEPTRFHLSTLPVDTPHHELVYEIKERWRTERMYEDLKGEIGFDHYEGRGWVGWNHHVSVVLCCYALLVGERNAAFPPSASGGTDADSNRRAA
jgi:SRSO17 transposase